MKQKLTEKSDPQHNPCEIVAGLANAKTHKPFFLILFVHRCRLFAWFILEGWGGLMKNEKASRGTPGLVWIVVHHDVCVCGVGIKKTARSRHGLDLAGRVVVSLYAPDRSPTG